MREKLIQFNRGVKCSALKGAFSFFTGFDSSYINIVALLPAIQNILENKNEDAVLNLTGNIATSLLSSFLCNSSEDGACILLVAIPLCIVASYLQEPERHDPSMSDFPI